MPTSLAHALRPNRVTVFEPRDVTTIAPDEEAPHAGGLTDHAIARIWESMERLYRTGLHPSLAVCIRRHGRVVLHRTLGHSHGNTPQGVDEAALRLATPSTLYNLFSASKSITAMLVHLLDDEGVLHIDDRVAEYIPEFGVNGKEAITLRHVLAHRSGLALIDNEDADIRVLADEDEVLRRLCAARPTHAPGRRLAYHALSGGFILAEVMRRVTGKHIRTLLDERVRGPLGMGAFQYGVPKALWREVAVDTFTGPPPPFPVSYLLQRAFGAPAPDAVRLAASEDFLTACVPSGNLICTADEACRFFELLLRGGTLDGVTVFSPRTIQRARIEQSYHEYDLVLQYPFRYGLGFMLGSKRSSVLGPDTEQAFGHMGFTNVIAYADPERDISVAFMNSGKPLIAVESLWWINATRTICESIPKVG